MILCTYFLLSVVVVLVLVVGEGVVLFENFPHGSLEALSPE